MPLQATSGAASYDAFGGGSAAGGVANYIEDVFSTYLYTGNGASQTITNGIDLSTKGGMVWIKNRPTAGTSNIITDTVRGKDNGLVTNSANAQNTITTGMGFGVTNCFLTDGFTLRNSSDFTAVGENFVSWTFRKQPKFFDVVTISYTGSAITVNHALGSVPGCIIIKLTTGTDNWYVYHRSVTGTDSTGALNSTLGFASPNGYSNFASSITSTSFTFNAGFTSGTYVAYLFAHDAGGFGLTGTDNVISCGSYTGNGSSTGPVVTLGYEPQWLLLKSASVGGSGYNWVIIDNMRGFPVGSSDAILRPNLTSAEVLFDIASPTATGFNIVTSDASVNAVNETYIYIAIRRGPMKVPTTGTSVFYPNAVAQADSPDSTGVPFPPDLINTFSRDGTNRTNNFSFFQFVDRLRGAGIPNNTRVAASEGLGLVASGTDAEYGTTAPFTYVQLKANSQDITHGTGWNSANYGNWINYFWRRAPSFFDVVCYTGTGVARTVTHNLAAVPELMIVKSRTPAGNDWMVYAAPLGNQAYLQLNRTNVATTSDPMWNNTTPTSSVFSVGVAGDVNGSGNTQVAYLFATLAGVSKVGSYTGTDTLQTINCGFTGGARFVLIKRTNTSGNWFVWDTARGMVAGTDPNLRLNSSANEENVNDVYTTAGGFQILGAPTNAINNTGDTYIFFAVS
jgi:hypothetical protein